MNHHYITSGTCSRAIDVKINKEGVIESVDFIGGCHGNTQGISALVCGMKVDEAVKRLRGIKCKDKSTSCPDQLACALEAACAN